MFMHQGHWKTLSSCVISLGLLAACGGGSGSSPDAGTHGITPSDGAASASAAASAADGSASTASAAASSAEQSQAVLTPTLGSARSGDSTIGNAASQPATASTATRGSGPGVRILAGSATTAGAFDGERTLISLVENSASGGAQAQATAAGTSTSSLTSTTTSTASVTTYAASVAGTAYYVNNNIGNDSNPGTSALPWKTLRRAAAAVLNRGDALLLHCESTWAEPLNLTRTFAPNGGITVGAYGSCPRRPLIKGGTAIAASAWTQVSTSASGTLYSTPMSSGVAGMLLNGQPMQRARHPNSTTRPTAFSISTSGTTGSKLLVSSNDKTSIADRELAGADVALHNAPFTIEAGVVSSYEVASGAVTLKTAPRTSIAAGAGYFFEGKRWMLDAPGEWLLDSASNNLLVVLAPGVTPSSVTLESLQARPTVSITGIPNVRIEYIAIDGSGDDGLRITESGASTIKGVVVANARNTGIQLSSTSGLAAAQGTTVQDCVVKGSGITGIGTSLTNSRITQNTVTDTGATVIGIMRPVGGIRLSQVPGSVVSGNDIRRSGYAAILFGNQPSLTIADNRIEDSCLLLTDCGSIYAWGSSASATRSQIVNNHILRTGDPAMVGSSTTSSGGAGDLSAGIYLDEGSDNLDIVGNFIDNSFVGINLHKAKRNLISGNFIYGVREAGVRAQSSGMDGLSVVGNRVEDNLIYAPVYFATGSDGVPIAIGGTPQLWIHQSDAASMFSTTAGNTSVRNRSLHIGGVFGLRWTLRSNGTNQNNNSSAWAKYAPTDTVDSPFLASIVNVQGTQLLANTSLASTPEAWSSYTYTKGASIVQFSSQTSCTDGCASLTPSTSNDVLQQTGLKPSGTGPDLMFVRYRVIAGSKATSAKLEVRSDVAPYASAGFLENATDIAAGGLLMREAFFKRTTKGDLRVTMKGTVDAPLLVDNVELYQVSSFQLRQAPLYGRLVVNQSTQAISVTCSTLAFATCTAVNESGAGVTWPLVVPAKSARMVFSRDSSWVQSQ